MKTWIKFIIYLIVGLSSYATIAVGMILIFEPEDLKTNVFAGIACLLCAFPCAVWSMYNGFNLNSWK